MLRTTARPAGLGLFVVALALGVAACGGSDKKAESTPTTKAPIDAGVNVTSGGSDTTVTTAGNPTSSGDLPSDACALLSDADVEAALGVVAEAKPSDRVAADGTGPQVKGCQWGEVAADSGVIAVQVSKPDPETGIDYLKAVVNASGGTGESVDIGDDGKLVPRAHIPYGGGVGNSVMFTYNGNTVVVGSTSADVEKVKSAAQTVLDNLNA